MSGVDVTALAQAQKFARYWKGSPTGDALAALLAEVERLQQGFDELAAIAAARLKIACDFERERDDARERYDLMVGEARKVNRACKQAHDRVRELEAALRGIADADEHGSVWMQEVARAALAASGEEQTDEQGGQS